MEFKNNNYKINIELDNLYIINSTDNKNMYKHLLNPGSHKENYSCAHIKVVFENKLCDFGLIGSKLIFLEDDNIIFEKDNLIINTSNEIIKIDLFNEKVLNYRQFQDYIFSINEIDEKRFLIYGEQFIRMYDNDFNEIWDFAGIDIFVSISISNKNTFEICDNRIKLYDYQDNYYELDFDGNWIGYNNLDKKDKDML